MLSRQGRLPRGSSPKATSPTIQHGTVNNRKVEEIKRVAGGAEAPRANSNFRFHNQAEQQAPVTPQASSKLQPIYF